MYLHLLPSVHTRNIYTTVFRVKRLNNRTLRNDVYELLVNTHVQIKIYREFYHDIIYIANGGHHDRINRLTRKKNVTNDL